MPPSPKKTTLPAATNIPTTGVGSPIPATNGADQFVLDRIRKIQSIRAMKVVVYGLGKRGKTRFACTFPKPLLLIGTEEGTQSIIGVDGVDFVQIYKQEEVTALTEYAPKKKYKSVVLDHGGGLQDFAVKDVGGFAEMPVQGSWGMLKREQWQSVSAQWKKRVKDILDLPAKFGINAVVVAHERSFKDEDSGTDLTVPTIGPALTPTCANWLNGECDYICNCFIRERVENYEEDIGGVKVPMTRRTGQFEYGMRIGPHSVYMTGFRVPMGSNIPDVITDPTYEKIAMIARGEWKQ